MVTKFKKNKKSKNQSVVLPVFLGVLIIGAIGFLIYSNLKINEKRTKLNIRIESLKEQIKVLEERKNGLQANVSYRKSEEYLEEVARDKLNLMKPGEKVVAVTKEEHSEAKEEKKGFFKKILERVGIQ